ncbi:uncharacterized protein LOC119632857 [Glossina fuscipes]|uniref:Uncharacterized protein LOC119632857 n=2 Tax=Nemorhina TaxID=44051 RepID=A0A8U0W9Q1_9MUSC|nr:uncharacterized protein LOC119632857 [Glossina fuscipes]
MNKVTKPTDWYYTETNPTCKTPKTTTQDMLEKGILVGAGQKGSHCRQLNFQSYPVSDADLIKKRSEAEKTKVAITTSYKRDFTLHYPPLCGPLEREFIPDTLFNRRPLADFPSPDVTNLKFMDDHFVHLSEHRKKFNFLRQLRNAHHPLI